MRKENYQGMFKEFDPNDADPLINLHDFGGGSTRLDVRIGANARVWSFCSVPNPFDGSANTADYDLLLVDATGNTLAISNDDQIHTTAPPLEALVFANYEGTGDNGRCGGQSRGRASLALLAAF